MASINDIYQHKCSTFTNKHSMFFFLLYVNSAACTVRKDIIGHGMSNGWLHFVDLFRLSDADIERTTICTALWRNLGERYGLVSKISFHATLNGSIEDRRTLKTRSRHAYISKKAISHYVMRNNSNVVRVLCADNKEKRIIRSLSLI